MTERNMEHMKRGFSLVFVLIVIALLGGLLAALFSLTASFVESGERLLKQTQALALAEAGAQKAIHELSYNTNYTGETDFSLSSTPGVVDITVTAPTSETRLITSQSFYPSKANPKYSRKVQLQAQGNPEVAGDVFSFAIQSGNGGFYSPENRNPNIRGSIYSNENVELLGTGSKVSGDVSAVGTVTINGHVGGTVTEGVESKSLPQVDFDYWKNEASKGITHEGDLAVTSNTTLTLGGAGNISIINGRLQITSSPKIYLAGPVWVKGTGGNSLEISGNPSFIISSSLPTNKTILLADQRIVISGNASVSTDKPDAWLLFTSTHPGTLEPSTPAIEINANVHFKNTIVYAYNGQLWFKPNTSGVFGGSFVAPKLLIDSNLKLEWQSGLATISFNDGEGPQGGGFSFISGTYSELKVE